MLGHIRQLPLRALGREGCAIHPLNQHISIICQSERYLTGDVVSMITIEPFQSRHVEQEKRDVSCNLLCHGRI